MCPSEECLKGLKLVKFSRILCDDFLLAGLKYQHRSPPSPHVDFITIRLDLKDTRSGSIYQVRRYVTVSVVRTCVCVTHSGMFAGPV